MDSHLPVVVGVGTISTGGHSSAELELFSWNSGDPGDDDIPWSLSALGNYFVAFLNFVAQLFQRLNVSVAQGQNVVAQDLSGNHFHVLFLIVSGFVVCHVDAVYNL